MNNHTTARLPPHVYVCMYVCMYVCICMTHSISTPPDACTKYTALTNPCLSIGNLAEVKCAPSTLTALCTSNLSCQKMQINWNDAYTALCTSNLSCQKMQINWNDAYCFSSNTSFNKQVGCTLEKVLMVLMHT